MKTNKWRFNRRRVPVLFILVLFLFAGASCRDLLENETPGWLGESIYTNLKNDGHFVNMTKLIDDLDYTDVLNKTRSSTLFVFDDDAFERFFRSNKLGVTSYSDLSMSQKKVLLFGNLLGNSYSLNMLSSTPGPNYGDALRRDNSMSIYDSVTIMKPEEMPDSKYWKFFKNTGASIYCMMDMTKPMIFHFLEKQLLNHNITNEDIGILMNDSVSRTPGDASINGIPVIKKNIKCANGFVHQLQDVSFPLDNMAESIRKNANTQVFSKLIERFSAPYKIDAVSRKSYNDIHGTNIDTIYQKRYFSSRSQSGQTLTADYYSNAVSSYLKFDPGWNTYYPSNSSVTTSRALQQDMGAMFVPTDEAMMEYLTNGSGKVLTDFYKPSSWDISDLSCLDFIPDNVVAELINVNMMSSFNNSVPSKFNTILDDASYSLGIKKVDVDSVLLCNNGAVYLTNKVFSPTAYTSVSFPALIDKRLSIANWAIVQKKYNAYLNAKESTYSLFIPSNDALKNYIDPVSYGMSQTKLFKFSYNATLATVVASIWDYDLTTNQIIGVDSTIATSDQIINRLYDVLETHTVVGDVEDGNTYYKTKGGSTLKIFNTSLQENGMQVAGSFQIDNNSPVNISKVYQEGNGKAYILESSPIQTTRNTVYDVLMSHPEKFEKFASLLIGSGLLVATQNGHATASKNIGLFSKYHYTVYVPSNDSIEALQIAGKLSNWDVIDSLANTGVTADSLKALTLATTITEFLKYHIQDNSITVDKRDVSGQFETASMNKLLKVFYTIDVTATNNGEISITDLKGNTRHVVKSNNLYNLIAREYQYNNANPENAQTLFSTADVIIHEIDGPLMH
jgi:uncharacterized surface protein with fasciclin (FAS1) repeats